MRPLHLSRLKNDSGPNKKIISRPEKAVTLKWQREKTNTNDATSFRQEVKKRMRISVCFVCFFDVFIIGKCDDKKYRVGVARARGKFQINLEYAWWKALYKSNCWWACRHDWAVSMIAPVAIRHRCSFWLFQLHTWLRHIADPTPFSCLSGPPYISILKATDLFYTSLYQKICALFRSWCHSLRTTLSNLLSEDVIHFFIVSTKSQPK